MALPMRSFRKKPIVIQAFEYTPELTTGDLEAMGFHFTGDLIIQTLEGDLHAQHGDWIIRGIAGEYYPCKPDIFAATYDEVGEPVLEQESRVHLKAILASAVRMVDRMQPQGEEQMSATVGFAEAMQYCGLETDDDESMKIFIEADAPCGPGIQGLWRSA